VSEGPALRVGTESVTGPIPVSRLERRRREP
jgi:hypothetical protein